MKIITTSPVLRQWIPLAFVIIVLTGLVYVVAQQSYRLNANDPQIQIAEELSAVLSSGEHSVSEINPGASADIAKTQNTFILIYDNEGKGIVGSGRLNGAFPEIPPDVFAYAKANGTNRITWEPQDGLRYAAVVQPYQDINQSGYIVVARSLKTVDARINTVCTAAFLASLLALLGSFVLIMFLHREERKKVLTSDDISLEEELKDLKEKEENKGNILKDDKEED